MKALAWIFVVTPKDIIGAAFAALVVLLFGGAWLIDRWNGRKKK